MGELKVWLDDERPNPPGWVWVKTGQEAIHLLKSMRDSVWRSCWTETDMSVWTIVEMSFDHDLADVHYDYWHLGHNPQWKVPMDDPRRVEARRRSAKEMTGYDVLLWMAEHGVWPTRACYVHTHNSARAQQMCGVINRYGPFKREVRWTPYQPTAEEIKALTDGA